ncbi:apolipoprotein L3-like [Haliotis rufescens]|uniref:apolipoprotein L3-like n=1 Tax=Haliotis rufescens TaxID=6454 RepID=UPI001EB0A971|nr:apolipoprotein L3-like [Haliotis rufescens]
MGNSRDDSLEQASSDCRDVQKRTASKLRKLAEVLREKQRQMNIAKVSFHSAGIVSGGLSIAGAFLAPFTGGLSIALIVAGGGIGVASGVGDLTTQAIEFSVVNEAIEKAQEELDRLSGKLNKLVEELKIQLKAYGMSEDEIGHMIFKVGVIGYQAHQLHENIKKALDIVRAASHAQKIALSLDGGQVVADAVEGAMAGATANPKLAGGVAGFKALSKGAKVLRAAGPVGSAVGIGLSIKGLFEDGIRLHNNVSEVADVINKMANKLEEC